LLSILTSIFLGSVLPLCSLILLLVLVSSLFKAMLFFLTGAFAVTVFFALALVLLVFLAPNLVDFFNFAFKALLLFLSFEFCFLILLAFFSHFT
jgi:hypothetical protein